MASPPSLDGFLRARMRRRCLSLGIDLRIARRAYKALRETGRPNTFAVCGYSPGAGCATPRVFAFGASLDEAFSKARARLAAKGPRPPEVSWFVEACFDGGPVCVPKEYWPPWAAGGTDEGNGGAP